MNRLKNIADAQSKLRLLAAVVLAAFLPTTELRAAFHLWTVSEIYSSADGSVQFVEFSTSSGGQGVLGGQSVTSFNANSSLSVAFTFPNNLVGDTTNRRFLIGTPGFAALAGVTPDYTFTTNPFLFLGSGRLTFSGGDSVTFANLPNNGVSSLVRSGGSMVFSSANSPQNFAGQIGSVPEPGVWAILGSGVLTLSWILRRRRNS